MGRKISLFFRAGCYFPARFFIGPLPRAGFFQFFPHILHKFFSSFSIFVLRIFFVIEEVRKT